MSDYNSSDTIIMKPAVSSLGGNSAQYTSNKVGGNKTVKGGISKGSRVGGQAPYKGGKKTQKRRKTAKKSSRKSAKKCWWKIW